MSYIGRVEQKASDIRRFNVTGSTSATHTLTWTAPNEQSLIITINGVKQQEDAYSVSGTTLTLTSGLVSTDKMEVVGILDIGEAVTPPDDSISTIKIQDDAVTADKLANSINTEIAANTAKVTNATHTGDVTGSTALTIANDAVDIAMLSATGTASATTFLRGDNAWAEAGGGKVLQVVQTVKTDTFSNTGNTFVDITGLSVSITPSATSSKILIFATLNGSSHDRYYAVRLVRDSTDIFIGDTSGSRRRVTLTFDSNGSNEDQDYVQRNVHLTYLDSPSTTSATTYKPQIAMYDSSSTAYINRPYYDTDASWITRSASNIIAMEIAG